MSWLSACPRLRFSLRALLVASALICTYFGGRTEARWQVRELEIERNELREKVAKFDRAVARQAWQKMVLSYGGLWCSPPPVAPVALKVQNGEIEILLGSDDGMKPGMLIDLRRDEVVTATVKVIRTTADRSIAIPLLQSDLCRIRRGDHAIVR
jgi:hypothetical protein